MDSSWVDTGLQLTDTEGCSSRTFEVYQNSSRPVRSGSARTRTPRTAAACTPPSSA